MFVRLPRSEIKVWKMKKKSKSGKGQGILFSVKETLEIQRI